MRMPLLFVGIFIVVIAAVAFYTLRKSEAPRPQAERPTNLQQGPIRHQSLSGELDARIRRFESVFAEVYSRTHEEWLDGFQRDANPESEVAIWETIASAYQSFINVRSLSIDAKKEAFGLLLVRSSGDEQRTLSGAKLRHLSRAEAVELLHYYSAAPKPIIYENR